MAQKTKSAALKQVPRYPKHLVYPPGGGEFQLEQLRAALPRYRYRSPPESPNETSCDMELTTACAGNITQLVPVVPSGEKGKMLLQGRLVKKNELIEQERVDEEMEKVFGDRPSTVRLPVAPSVDPIEQEMEKLMLEREEEVGESMKQWDASQKENLVSAMPSKAPFHFTPSVCEEPSSDRWRTTSLMTKLSFSEADHTHSILGRSSHEGGGDQSVRGTLPHEHKVMLSEEQQKFENEFVNGFTEVQHVQQSRKPLQPLSKHSSSVSHSTQPSSSMVEQPTLDSFSVYNESASLAAYHDSWAATSTTQPPGGARKPLGNIGGKPSQSAVDSSGVYNESASLAAYHDSWAATSTTQPPGGARKPLGNIGGKPSVSSHSAVESFSVYNESSSQASLAIYHDSWAANTTQPHPPSEPARPGSVRKPLGELGRGGSGSVSQSRIDSFSVFEDPSQLSINQSASQAQARLPPPGQPSLPHTSQAAHVPSSNVTMTEIDIPHHTQYEPTSTPCRQNHPSLDMTADITAITMLHDPAMDARPLSYRQPPPRAPPPSLPPPSLPPPSCPPPSLPPAHHKVLYTITEESRSSYGSSSNTTQSSSSSTSTANQSCVSNLSCPPTELQDLISCGVMDQNGAINPFTQECVEFMLSSLPITSTPITSSENKCPRVAAGSSVVLQSSTYTHLQRIAKGGFAAIYCGIDSAGTKKALKIQSPPCLWEVAVIEELHRRLKANNLTTMIESFMSVDHLEQYSDTSIIITRLYQQGTLLDLANYIKGKRLQIAIMSYYVTEILTLVEHLHHCGIMHGDLKPDNIMLKDISNLTVQQAKGRGICLIDFGRAIDVRMFPSNVQFSGSSCTDGFQCREMLNQQPWKWQLDYHGIAAIVYVLLFGKYLNVSAKGSYSFHYLPRSYHHDLWANLLNALLTPSGQWGSPTFLSTLRQPFDAILNEEQKNFTNHWLHLMKQYTKT